MAGEQVVAQALLEIKAQLNAQSVQDSANQAASKIQQALQGATNKVSDTITKTLGGAFKSVATIGAGALGGLLGTSIKLGLGFQALNQQVNAGLTALLGSSAAAKDLLKQVNNLANSSPFQRESFLSATQQLVSFGVSAQKVVPILDAIQQAVAGFGGSSQDIGEIANIFAQISTQGKITGDDINRLSIRGVNAAQILSKAFNKSVGSIKADASSLNATGTQIIEALTKGIQEQFGGATAALDDTLQKAQDKFRSARRFLGVALVSPFVGAEKGGAFVTILNNVNAAIKSVTANLAPVTKAIQSFADKMVSASTVVTDFIKSITSTQISAFLDKLKEFAPIVALAAGALGGFGTTILGQIPILGSLVGEINPVAGALIAFAASIPAVRDQLVKIGQAILTEAKPALAALRDAFPAIIKAIGDIANTVGPAFIQVIQVAGPLLTVAAHAAGDLAGFISTLANAFQKLGVVGTTVLAVLITRFAAVKLASSTTFAPLAAGVQAVVGAFSGVSAAVSGVVASFRGIAPAAAGALGSVESLNAAIASAAAEGIPLTAVAAQFQEVGAAAATAGAEVATAGGFMAAAKTAVAGVSGALSSLGTALTGIVNPINIAIAAFIIYQNTVNDAKKKVDELFDATTKGLDLGNLDEANSALKQQNDIVDALGKKLKDNGKIGGVIPGLKDLTAPGFLKKLNDVVDPQSGLKAIKNEKEYQDALKKRDALLSQIQIRQDILNKVTAATGKSAKEILDIAKSGGIDLLNVSPQNEATVVAKIQGLFVAAKDAAAAGGAAAGTAFADAFNNTPLDFTTIQQSFDAALKPIQSLIDAEGALKNANEAVTSAQDRQTNAIQATADAQDRHTESVKKIRDLTAERLKILRDTISPADELAKAQRSLVLDGLKVNDIQKSILQTQKEIAALRDPSILLHNQELATRDVQRAQIALDEAKQAELDLTKAVNKEQIPEVNLAGLTLDQARNKLAAVRATLAAQKQGQATTADAGKTQQQLDDERLSKRLDVLDAEDRLKAAQVAAAEVQKKNADDLAAAEEHLLELQNQKIDANQQVITDQNTVNDLKRGETTLAKALKTIDDQIVAAKKDELATNRAVTAAVKDQAAAQKAVADAVNAQRIAQDKVALAIANSRMDIQAMVAAQTQLIIDQAKSLGPLGLISGEYARQLSLLQQQKQTISDQATAQINLRNETLATANGLQDLFNKSVGNKDLTGQLLAADSLPNQLLDAANIALTKDPTDVFAQAIKDILLKLFAQRFSGFATGGVIGDAFKNGGYVQGAPGPKGHTIHVGEYAMAEAVLPLRNAFHMDRVLGDKRVLEPIMASLGRINVPTINLTAAARPATVPKPYGPISTTKLNMPTARRVSDFEERRKMEDQAEMIGKALAKELVAAGIEGGIAEGAVNVTIQQTAPHQALSEREIKRIIEKSLRGI